VVTSPQEAKNPLKIRIKGPEPNQIRISSLRENKLQKGNHLKTEATEGRFQQSHQEN
jgi:hypothetical protein